MKKLELSDWKTKMRNTIINDFIIESGIKENQSVVLFGCENRDNTLLNHLIKKIENIECICVDPCNLVINSISAEIKSDKISFIGSTPQEVIDSFIESSSLYDWSILDGILNKEIYGDSQYYYVDSIIRSCLQFSKIGTIIVFDSSITKNNESYNIGFIIAYLLSTYNRYNLLRLNEDKFIISIYKHYY
jgi:hypothetical protein